MGRSRTTSTVSAPDPCFMSMPIARTDLVDRPAVRRVVVETRAQRAGAMEEAHAEAMLSAFGISNECALGRDVVPMVFGFFRYPRSWSYLMLRSYGTQLEMNLLEITVSQSQNELRRRTRICLQFVGFRKATRVLG